MDDLAGNYLCAVCALDFLTSSEFTEHKRTNDHRINWLEKQYRLKRLEYVKDKCDIRINVDSENPKITYYPEKYTVEMITSNPQQEESKSDSGNEDDEPLSFTFQIFHKGKLAFYLTGIDVLSKLRLIESDTQVLLKDIHQLSNRSKIINFQPGNRYDVTCTVVPGAIARALHIPILFEFLPVEDCENSQPFYIGKTLEIKGTSYTVRNFGHYIKGVKPPKKIAENCSSDIFFQWQNDPLKHTLELKEYHIPPWFQTLAFNNNPKAIRKKMDILDHVTSVTHKQYFRTLLWLEELQEELDIQFYSRKGIKLVFPATYNRNGVLLVELFENDLGEKRPCVLPHDRVFVCLSKEAASSESVQWYEGYVHRVTNNKILIGFHQHLFARNFSNEVEFNLEYVMNRYTLRIAHRALDLVSTSGLSPLLFPQAQINAPSHQLPEIMCYDQHIATNPEQLQAVQQIVTGNYASSPYVIFGPPGTGKTVTVVEAIKQVLHLVPKSYVLACAPSNTAADVLAERLLDHFDKRIVIRLYAESRVQYLKDLPPRLLDVSNYFVHEKVVLFPNKELMKRRVIVCTFITAAKIAAAQLPLHHFTHVFLDEAGHAMETDSLVGIAGILPPWGQLIMAGDPHQLGPVVRNLQAMAGGPAFPRTGLDTSLLERIMAIPQYQQNHGHYDSNLVTKLVKNYRSHPSILKLSNELFYNSELQARGARELVNYFCAWEYLPKKGFPIIFHSVRGEDKMEKFSPSYHNPQEAKTVLMYMRKLQSSKIPVKPSEIGIITPYRLQVEKLRQLMTKELPSFSETKIGSVEDFQGEERKVIIISTVRATNRHLCKDHVYKLGFLKNPKRFNVALTRAQCLLIVIGCPAVLMLDNNWKKLILYIQDNGGYVGPFVQAPPQNIDDIIKQMQGLNLRPTVSDISQRQVVEVPPWNRT